MDNQVPFVKTSNNSGKGFLIFLIIVLLLCCLGLGGYIVYTKFFVKEEVIVMDDTSKALKEVQLDGESLLEVEDIINTFEYAYNDSFSNYFGYIYKSNKLEISQFDKGAALFACLYPDLEESANISYVANNTVKTKFKKTFGSNFNYDPANVNAGEGYEIKYDPVSKYYSYQRLGVGGYFYPTYVSFNESSSVSNEKIQVVKKVAYLEYSADHTTINVYADSEKKNTIGVISVTDGSFTITEIKAKFKSSLAEYTYTFVKDKDSFVFDSIERTK